ADHGGTPMPELSGGQRLLDSDLLRDLNAHFGVGPNMPPVALYVTSTQLWTDPSAMAALGISEEAIVDYLRTYRVDGRPFYRLVLPAGAIEAERSALVQRAARLARSAP